MINDAVNHPKHYEEQSANGYEPIELCEQFGFCLGNAMKYLIRAGHKANAPEAQDLKKARWYLLRHLERYLDDGAYDKKTAFFRAKAFRENNAFIATLCREHEFADLVSTATVASTIRMIDERLEELK